MGKPFVYGSIAAISLLSLYGLVMTLLGGWGAAVSQFQALWYFMLPLAIGFGVQIGLFTKLKEVVRARAQTSVVAGGASAGAAMLACCAHHVTDVLPLIGLSAASAIVAAYQVPILVASLGINIIGILFMIGHLRKVVS